MAYSLLQAQATYPATLTLGALLEADFQAWGGSTLPVDRLGGVYTTSGSALALTAVDLFTLANLPLVRYK